MPMAPYRARVGRSPMMVTSVVLPTAASVWRSRKLLTSSRQSVTRPWARARSHTARGTSVIEDRGLWKKKV